MRSHTHVHRHPHPLHRRGAPRDGPPGRRRAFAARGFHGTPTTEIAKAAGISQAYLFRLFPTKRELFVALVRPLLGGALATFARRPIAAPRPATARPRSPRWAPPTASSLRDRDALLLQLQTHAAADDPEVREAVRRGFRRPLRARRPPLRRHRRRAAGLVRPRDAHERRRGHARRRARRAVGPRPHLLGLTTEAPPSLFAETVSNQSHTTRRPTPCPPPPAATRCGPSRSSRSRSS